jgi:hypothetical protein
MCALPRGRTGAPGVRATDEQSVSTLWEGQPWPLDFAQAGTGTARAGPKIEFVK